MTKTLTRGAALVATGVAVAVGAYAIGELNEVTLTATWTKFKPENVTYAVDGAEQFVHLRTMRNTDSWSITVPDHEGATYSVTVYMGAPPRGGYTYGCSITRGGIDIATPRSSIVPGGISCFTT